MTAPEVDQELERLFSATRAATAPDSGARARIRAGVVLQLSSGAATAAATRGFGKWTWFGVGSAVVSIGALLWLSNKPGAVANAPSAVEPARRVVTAAESPVVPAVPAVTSVAEPAAAATTAPAAESVAPAVPHASVRPLSKAVEPNKPEASATPVADPAAELELVRAMQQALRSGNPSQALVLASQHAQRFPGGTLAQEREGVRAIAQCQLAKPEARAGILEQFNQRFGGSPYTARVKAACQ
jgi:hypothetical protein